MYLVAFPPQPTYQHFWVVLARNLKYNRFKTNYRDALNNDGGLPNCRFSSQTLSQANTTRLYETVNCISAESALLPRQINWLDLYICPTEFKQKERTRERERGKYHLRCCLIEKGRISQTLSSDFPVHSGNGGHMNPLWDHPGQSSSSWRFWTQSFPSLPRAQAPGIPVSCTPASKSFLGCVPLDPQLLSLLLEPLPKL